MTKGLGNYKATGVCVMTESNHSPGFDARRILICIIVLRSKLSAFDGMATCRVTRNKKLLFEVSTETEAETGREAKESFTQDHGPLYPPEWIAHKASDNGLGL